MSLMPINLNMSLESNPFACGRKLLILYGLWNTNIWLTVFFQEMPQMQRTNSNKKKRRWAHQRISHKHANMVLVAPNHSGFNSQVNLFYIGVLVHLSFCHSALNRQWHWMKNIVILPGNQAVYCTTSLLLLLLAVRANRSENLPCKWKGFPIE